MSQKTTYKAMRAEYEHRQKQRAQGLTREDLFLRNVADAFAQYMDWPDRQYSPATGPRLDGCYSCHATFELGGFKEPITVKVRWPDPPHAFELTILDQSYTPSWLPDAAPSDLLEDQSWQQVFEAAAQALRKKILASA